MGALIYGIDSSKKITPLMVRDSMVNCFYQAHCQDSGLTEDDGANREYCKTIVKKAFDDVSADFEHPTKEGIHRVLDKLAEFSKGFRDPKIIEKHYTQIQQLVERL